MNTAERDTDAVIFFVSFVVLCRYRVYQSLVMRNHAGCKHLAVKSVQIISLELHTRLRKDIGRYTEPFPPSFRGKLEGLPVECHIT